jgi:hypothetical protein
VCCERCGQESNICGDCPGVYWLETMVSSRSDMKTVMSNQSAVSFL